MPQQSGPDDDLFVDSGGGLHDNAHDTIEANLSYEAAWGTGVGCAQDADNLDSSDSDDD